MHPGSIVGVAFGLAMDAFAVAIASSVSLGKVSPRQVFRLAFHFGLFQALMPLIGWLGGLTVERWVGAWDHWAAFGLLAFIGGRGIAAAFRKEGAGGPRRDPTRGLTLLMLSVATSVDALAVGLSLGLLEVTIWYPITVIGLIAAAMTALGMLLGGRLGVRFGKRMEIVGGLVLIGIGVKIVAEHLAAG